MNEKEKKTVKLDDAALQQVSGGSKIIKICDEDDDVEQHTNRVVPESPKEIPETVNLE